MSHLFGLHPRARRSRGYTRSVCRQHVKRLSTGCGTRWAYRLEQGMDYQPYAAPMTESMLLNTSGLLLEKSSPAKSFWTNHPPSRLTATYGGTAGIARCFCRVKRRGEPAALALPMYGADGSVTGLKARVILRLTFSGKLSFKRSHCKVFFWRTPDIGLCGIKGFR